MEKFLILYGSETGTAQDVAEVIWREANHRGYLATLSPMDGVELKSLRNGTVAIFVLSTTGQGQEPSNMRTFWKFLLRRSLPADSLQHLHCAVLGLGDSSYEKFNFAAKKLFRRLKQLGADIFAPLGLADDQHQMGIDAVCDLWIAALWPIIGSFIPPSHVVNTTGLFDPKVSVLLQPTEMVSSEDGNLQRNTLELKVIRNERVTADDHFQETRLITLDYPQDLPPYHPGDVLMVMPKNLPDVQREFLDLLNEAGHDVDQMFVLKRNQVGSVVTWPSGWLNLRKCVSELWDVQSVPRRSFFRLLSKFASNDREKDRLAEFASPEGLDDLYSYCNRPRRNIVEVLSDFKETFAQVPLDYLFDLLPLIRPRAFSIASNFTAHPGVIQILVAVVKFRTKLAKPRRGLCSTWLSGLKPSDPVSVWLRDGTIRFPSDVNTACIMVGPGTGVAPFRNFIAGRAEIHVDGNWLFFGCRNESKDLYFRDEWERYGNLQVVNLTTAFSRDQPEKIYVQHKILAEGQRIWEWMRDGASVMIAGSAKEMPTAVKGALLKCLEEFGSLSHSAAEQFLNDRLQSETWS